MNAQDTGLYYQIENYTFKITTTSPRGQWVKSDNLKPCKILQIQIQSFYYS